MPPQSPTANHTSASSYTAPPSTTHEARDTFLSHFDPPRRSAIANWLLQPVREWGADSPALVLTLLIGQLHKRLSSRWCTGQEQANIEHAIRVIEAHRDEALAAAAYYISYGALPDTERERLKARQREEGRNTYMASKPPSQKQLDYLHMLGFNGEPPATMAEASNAIDHILAGRRKAVQR